MTSIDLDARTAAAIAAGMQAVALADGHAHPAEQALIEAFRAELPSDVDTSHAHFEDDATREVLVRSLLLVAYADGRVSDEERAVINELAGAHGVSAELLARVEETLRRELLGHLTGVKVFREQAEAVGAELGLDPATTASILGD